MRHGSPPVDVPPEVESSEIWEAWALWSVLGRRFDVSDDSNDAFFVCFWEPAGLSRKGLEKICAVYSRWLGDFFGKGRKRWLGDFGSGKV